MVLESAILSLCVMVGGWSSAPAAPSVEIRHTSPHVANPNVIPKNEIFEMTLAKAVDYGTAANFRDVTLSVDFIAPHGGSVTTIHGFYYYTLPNGGRGNAIGYTGTRWLDASWRSHSLSWSWLYRLRATSAKGFAPNPSDIRSTRRRPLRTISMTADLRVTTIQRPPRRRQHTVPH